MAKKESSVAPKERINVTFKPATGGAVEEIELPLKMTVIGDFLQRRDDRRLGERKPVNINKNNFNDVMAKQDLSLDVAIPNPLDKSGDSTIPVHLKFQSMGDFKPEALIEQVDVLRDMQNIRNALVSVKGPLGNLPTLKKAIDGVLKNSEQREQLKKELEKAGIDLGQFVGGSKSKGRKEDKPEDGAEKQ